MPNQESSDSESKTKTELLYLGCPMCGRSVTLGQLSDKTFDSYDIDWAVFQFRKAKGGRGRGGFFVTRQGLSIKEMLRNPIAKPLAEKLTHRLKLIFDSWKKEGLV